MMSFATMADIATMILCAAVMVQSVRMMRALHRVRGDAVAEVVKALDQSTGHARAVLAELKTVLVDCASHGQVLTQARAMADELTVMIGIADASADRMTEAANAARNQPAAEEPAAVRDEVRAAPRVEEKLWA